MNIYFVLYCALMQITKKKIAQFFAITSNTLRGGKEFFDLLPLTVYTSNKMCSRVLDNHQQHGKHQKQPSAIDVIGKRKISLSFLSDLLS